MVVKRLCYTKQGQQHTACMEHSEVRMRLARSELVTKLVQSSVRPFISLFLTVF